MNDSLLENYQSFLLYLAGPIDFSKDKGASYRTKLNKLLKKIGIEKKMILDPTQKPLNHLEAYKDFDTEQDFFDALVKHKRWDDYEKYIKTIMHIDLRMVDKSDVIIATVNPDIPMCGTWHEVVEARQQKKPVLLVDPRGKAGTSRWAVGLVGHKNIFETHEEAVEFLGDVISGKMPVDNDEWLFLHFKNGNGKK
jgi:nucleoside 2-deoxyribosyltransferase